MHGGITLTGYILETFLFFRLAASPIRQTASTVCPHGPPLPGRRRSSTFSWNWTIVNKCRWRIGTHFWRPQFDNWIFKNCPEQLNKSKGIFIPWTAAVLKYGFEWNDSRSGDLEQKKVRRLFNATAATIVGQMEWNVVKLLASNWECHQFEPNWHGCRIYLVYSSWVTSLGTSQFD